jgi:hypothetical protein
MLDQSQVFVCLVCKKWKPVELKYLYRGRAMCAWCAEDNGLVKP